jgi:hypothetical protein
VIFILYDDEANDLLHSQDNWKGRRPRYRFRDRVERVYAGNA